MQRMKSFLARSLSAFALLLLLELPAQAEVRLPQMFADNMVLQRDQPVPVWGWASAGDEVSVSFAGQTKTVRADGRGAWRVTLDAMPASAEPRELTAKAR